MSRKSQKKKNPMGRFPKTAQDCCGGFPVPRNAPPPFKPVSAFPNTIFGIRGVEQRRRGEKRSFWPIMSTVIKQTSLKTRVSTSVFSTIEGHNVWGVTCWRIMTKLMTNRHTQQWLQSGKTRLVKKNKKNRHACRLRWDLFRHTYTVKASKYE